MSHVEDRTDPTPPAAAGRSVDVWSRSGSRYRVRAVVLLVVNIALFAAVGSFAYWLRSGVRLAPVHEGYWDELLQTFRTVPLGNADITHVSLGTLLLEPISIQDVPMQIPIFGLLMATLISIPILVAMLYRFWASLPFIAIVAVLAVMPWLAVTLLISCVLATVPPFRTRYRFVSALMGLLPTVIYLTLAWAGTGEEVIGEIDPVDRIKFIAPWVLAIVTAALVFATVLAIAKVVDYRPGAIAPLLAVMLAAPVILFETRVGRDELYYRLLEALYHGHFQDYHARRDLDRAVREAWLRHPPPRPSLQAVRESVETRWLFELADDIRPVRSLMAEHKAAVVRKADEFIHYFPESRYAFNALYIRASALDVRADATEFKRTKWVRFYDDFPSVRSRRTWWKLLENQPASILGAVALLRLAQLDGRAGDVERAIARLNTLLIRFGAIPEDDGTATASQGVLADVLARNRPESSLHIMPEQVVLEAHRLYNLLIANQDPIYGYDPISGTRRRTGRFEFGLLDCDPRDGRYSQNVRTLLERYPNCQLRDNLWLELAKATGPLPEKIARLEKCLRQFPGADAAPEAMYRLAVAYRQGGRLDQSDRTLAALVESFPYSVWTQEAVRYVPARVLTAAAARLEMDPVP